MLTQLVVGMIIVDTTASKSLFFSQKKKNKKSQLFFFDLLSSLFPSYAWPCLWQEMVAKMQTWRDHDASSLQSSKASLCLGQYKVDQTGLLFCFLPYAMFL